MPATTDLNSSLLDHLSRSSSTMTLAALIKETRSLLGAKASKKSTVQAALEELTAQGTIRALCLNPRKPAELSYTQHDDARLTAHLLESAVRAAKKPPKLPDLRKKLPPILQAQFEPVLADLVAQRRLYLLLKATPLVLARPPSASDLIDSATLRRLRLLVQQVNQARASTRTVEGLIEWLDGADTVTTEEQVYTHAELTPELLREWYDADARRSSTRMIPLPQTWGHYTTWAAQSGRQPDHQEFRRMFETLYNSGRIWLEPCERPQDLPEDERALLLPLAIGPPGYAWTWAS